MLMSEHDKTWHGQHLAGLSKGERAADYLRNGMGSWTFVGCFVLAMVVWAAINSYLLAGNAWDPYPFILLNLFLSMLAGLQGAILLIAAKRQDAIAAAMAQHDFDTDVQAKAEIDRLMAINSEQLELLGRLLAALPQSGVSEEDNDGEKPTPTRGDPSP
ncbi:hypothetical protein StoSoilB3_19950 [Arthrobacter sp. StoSoilB3]|nr:hypothetical protein NtRootA2_19020 [Arthrobacter sp. NtRootA2]BCW14703.1 hypothetical protein NtRootA4_16820 [Arthrobacter sp. NtRootA4]BCW23038.1 hypothetical protein NtRootC7_19050 [Arthrobacter sp. NtRootC7]BCW27306.1 hypothetical protein NtRootC45_19060 [Arthrobacter sp. NtRootC45]BCW31573.1 hypothetical protein NtRootD5_19040 [Arthrobacter sp. NtRootD5]BCW40460.1 hypothetical protein StoSoilB3_19950 [Arthrobacter sp. StoSoilB3]